MYSVNFLTTTPAEVIARSMICHPSALTEALEAAHTSHAHYRTYNRTAQEIAQQCAADCRDAAQMIHNDDIESIMSEMRLWIPVFHCACRLQLVTPSLRSLILEYGETV